MSSHQLFTPKQLERVESAVNFVLAPTDGSHTPGTVVKDVLLTQDLVNARFGSIVPVKVSSPISFLQLPAEIRNGIYRYCLVVGEVYPRPKPEIDDRLNDRSEFQKPQTQVFQLCRQILVEAAPLYFAENKFVLSHGELPWSHSTENLDLKPISRVAHQNLRSLSVTLDIRDGQILPSVLSTHGSIGHHHSSSFERWRKLRDLLQCFRDLQLLEASFQSCYCVFCHQRIPDLAVSYLLRGVRSFPRIVLRGLSAREISEMRMPICIISAMSLGNEGASWRPEYEDEDPNDRTQITFQVTKR
jgi:hypothetical protein